MTINSLRKVSGNLSHIDNLLQVLLFKTIKILF